MKRVWMLLAVLIALSAVALAEQVDAAVWTTLEDTYYHLDRNCGGQGEERYPLSIEAAGEFDKQPCPLCAVNGEAVDELPEITATQRGGTWVIRVPQARLESIPLNAPETIDAAGELSALYGGTLTDVMEVRLAVSCDDALFMNLRVIDGDAYMVLRPEKAYGKKRPLKWRVEAVSRDTFFDEGGEAALTGVSAELTYAPGDVGDKFTQVYTGKSGKIDITVYRAMDCNIAVLHRSGKTKASALTGLVKVGDLEPAIPVKGYVAGGQTVYCCVITDAELGALVAGAKPTIENLEAEEGAETTEEPSDDGDFRPVATLAPDSAEDVPGLTESIGEEESAEAEASVEEVTETKETLAPMGGAWDSAAFDG